MSRRGVSSLVVITAGMCCLIALGAVSISCSSLPRYDIPKERGHDAGNTLDEGTGARLRGILDQAVEQYRLIGVQLSVKTGDGKTWNGASGTKDRKRKIPMSAEDPIRIGSITKVFTAVVIFRLIENGMLGLDQAVDAWFPDIPGGHTASLRHLLDHSSGIPEILPLGLIAEKATDKPPKDLYREQIIAPLGMRSTRFIPYEEAPANLVDGYDRNLIPLPGYHVVTPDNTSWSTCAFSSGAMVSTASDLSRFMAALMDARLVNEESLRAMTSFTEGGAKKEKYNKSFGLGLFRFDIFSGTIGHLGLFLGSEVLALYHPDKRYVIALAGNVSRFDKDGLVADIISILGH